VVIRFEPLGPEHDRGAFCCGNDTVNNFFRDCMDEHQGYRCRVHVALDNESSALLGYYALRLLLVGPKKYAQPEIELQMIGVQGDLQGQGIGTALMANAFEKIYSVAKTIGVTSLWLDAANERAAGFYARLGFEPVDVGTMKMFIPVKTIIEVVEST
jgi:GNAT superfamily N-acetyltransferase